MNRDALLVGINQYPFLKDTPTSKAKHLNTPASDAEAIALRLEEYGGFRVRRLPESIQEEQRRVDPKKLVQGDVLYEAIIQLFNPVGDSVPQTALLYFAGHGLRRNLGGVTEGFLATSDSDPRKNQWGREQPLVSLATAFLDEDVTDIERAGQLKEAEEAIAQGATGLARLIRASKSPRTVLIVDQFEEIFTVCQSQTDRQQFMSSLLGALKQRWDAAVDRWSCGCENRAVGEISCKTGRFLPKAVSLTGSRRNWHLKDLICDRFTLPVDHWLV